MSATVRAAIALISGQRRVFFEMPANGFGAEDLDALEVGIRHARRELLGQHNVENANPIIPPEPCG